MIRLLELEKTLTTYKGCNDYEEIEVFLPIYLNIFIGIIIPTIRKRIWIF